MMTDVLIDIKITTRIKIYTPGTISISTNIQGMNNVTKAIGNLFSSIIEWNNKMNWSSTAYRKLSELGDYLIVKKI